MREVSDKKSRLLYQSGNKATQGVVDLRCFASDRRGDLRSESVTRATRQSARPLDLRRVSRDIEAAKTERVFQEVKPVRTEAVASPRERMSAPASIEKQDAKIYRELDFPREWSTPSKKGISAEVIPNRAASALRLPSLPTFDPRILDAYRRKSFTRFVIASFLIPAILFSFS